MPKTTYFRYLLAALCLFSAVAICATSVAAPKPQTPGDQKAGIQTCDDVFIDVCAGAWFYAPVMNLHALGAVSGYEDGTFRPGNLLSRGQVMKVIVLAFGFEADLPSTNTFADVPLGSTFYNFVEIGYA
ncbi:MAG: S-layer homology domain-containing protein, partial [Chloroflexia bacterium]